MAVEVDGLRIGIRAQDEGGNDWLLGLLAGHLVDDESVPPNYSVRRSDDPHMLHLLYWGGCLVARCRTEEELVEAIDAHLGGHRPPEPGSVRLSGLAVQCGGEAVVLTQVDQMFGAKLAGKLRDLEARPLVRPWIDIDARSLQLAPRPSIGLRQPEPGPKLARLLVPAVLAELKPADRVIALQRSGALRLDQASLADTAGFLTCVSTESVEEYADSRVAASLRAIFTGSG
jgi:hypothetical protein